jgi:hypothetical protein
MELDIYIPSKGIAIEYDGIWWHSEMVGGKNKIYHLSKTEECESKNIHLLHIFEPDWALKKDIVKNRLKHLLMNSKRSIYARRCMIREISAEDKKLFLTNNHLQGNDVSSVRLGAYYNDKLVSVMTFGKRRVCMGGRSAENEYELLRFCNGEERVIGIAGKLFAYFIKTYHPSKIISYADRRYSSRDTFYSKIGFSLVSATPPNYWYFNLQNVKCLYHRFNFRKSELPRKLPSFDATLSEWENMKNNGWDRIWDCGNLKYEWIAD